MGGMEVAAWGPVRGSVREPVGRPMGRPMGRPVGRPVGGRLFCEVCGGDCGEELLGACWGLYVEL